MDPLPHRLLQGVSKFALYEERFRKQQPLAPAATSPRNCSALTKL
jgi:hypothetical protein